MGVPIRVVPEAEWNDIKQNLEILKNKVDELSQKDTSNSNQALGQISSRDLFGTVIGVVLCGNCNNRIPEQDFQLHHIDHMKSGSNVCHIQIENQHDNIPFINCPYCGEYLGSLESINVDIKLTKNVKTNFYGNS